MPCSEDRTDVPDPTYPLSRAAHFINHRSSGGVPELAAPHQSKGGNTTTHGGLSTAGRSSVQSHLGESTAAPGLALRDQLSRRRILADRDHQGTLVRKPRSYGSHQCCTPWGEP